MIKGFREFGNKIKTAKREFIDEGLRVPKQVNAVLSDYGKDINRAILKRMEITQKAPWSYRRGNRIHHPSMPGGYPAIDRGKLKKDIFYDVDRMKLEIGSSLNYSKWLEIGTKKMKARPWLKNTVVQFDDEIIFDVGQLIPRAISNILIKIR